MSKKSRPEVPTGEETKKVLGRHQVSQAKAWNREFGGNLPEELKVKIAWSEEAETKDSVARRTAFRKLDDAVAGALPHTKGR